MMYTTFLPLKGLDIVWSLNEMSNLKKISADTGFNLNYLIFKKKKLLWEIDITINELF